MDDATYLDLSAGPYALALLARTVVLVRQDVPVAPELTIRGEQAPMCDLRRVFGGPARAEVPFLIAFEAEGRLAAVGVDRVGHLRRGITPEIRRIPTFGLVRAELIEGGFKDGDRLLLVLSPSAMARLTREVSQAI